MQGPCWRALKLHQRDLSGGKPMALKWRVVSLALGGTLLAGFLGFSAYEYVLGPRLALESVERGTMVHTIVASGRVETEHRVNLGAQITGTVHKVWVVEGQPVAPGQLLIELENTELVANLEQARAAEQMALNNSRLVSELKLPLAEQGLAQAQFNLRSAQRAAARANELHAQGFYGAAATEDAQRTLDLAQTQARIAAHQWTSVQANGPEAMSAESAVRQAQAAWQTANARLRYSRVTAPMAATVIARNVEAGDGVQPGKVVMVLSPTGTLQLVLQIDEKNLKWLQVGQNAWASADAFMDQKFAARVAFINPAVDPQRGAIEVRLDVTGRSEQLRQDMTASVDIEVARREDALHIALTAVHDLNLSAPWALVWREGRAVRQSLSLGLQSQGRVEVLSGLQAHDRLVPVAQTAVHEGDRIRLAPP